MIPLHEIRIGNYTLCDINRGGKISTEPCRVNLGMFAYCAEMGLDEFDVEPIPLTPGILEKAGFDNRSQNIFIVVIDHLTIKRIWVYKSHTDGYMHWYLGAENIHGEQISCLIVDYLHQLKNLYFALTGEELNVTL